MGEEKIIVGELLELMGAKIESGRNIGLIGGMRIKRERMFLLVIGSFFVTN